MELDPSQFLAQGSSDEDSENEEESRSESVQNGDGSAFLTSLGLTHVNSVSQSQFGSLAVNFKIIFVMSKIINRFFPNLLEFR